MKHLWALGLSLIVSWMVTVGLPTLAEAANCQFTGGFRTLHDLIPNIVGNCLDNERYNGQTGDGYQDTTGPTGKGGLLYWQKADNLTYFTDGYHTWVLGPYGLQERLNTQRFPWEPLPRPATGAAPGAGQSRNWAGYVATSGTFTAVMGTWTVPEPTAGPTISGEATWVGIGGVSSSDLIQAGTDEFVVPSGQVEANAWIETLPLPAQIVPLTVSPGDSVSISITQQADGSWLVQLTDNTTGQGNQQTIVYNSSLSSAEWIAEDPVRGRRLLPLENFGTVQLTNGTTLVNGTHATIAQAGGTPVAMLGPLGEILAVPSALGSDGASFTVTRGAPVVSVPPLPLPGFVLVP